MTAVIGVSFVTSVVEKDPMRDFLRALNICVHYRYIPFLAHSGATAMTSIPQFSLELDAPALLRAVLNLTRDDQDVQTAAGQSRTDLSAIPDHAGPVESDDLTVTDGRTAKPRFGDK